MEHGASWKAFYVKIAFVCGHNPFEIAKPKPVPVLLVVTKGSKYAPACHQESQGRIRDNYIVLRWNKVWISFGYFDI